MRRYEREPFEAAATFQEDTVRYIGRVKAAFLDQPDVYREFVDIVREVRRKELSPSVAQELISRLFLGHPDLVVDFQRFFGGFPDATPSPPDEVTPHRPASSSRVPPSSTSSSSSVVPTASTSTSTSRPLPPPSQPSSQPQQQQQPPPTSPPAPAARTASRMATLHNFIFFAAAAVVLCAAAVKLLLLYTPPSSSPPTSSAHLDAISRPFRDSFLHEHQQRTQQRQLTRAARLLRQHAASSAVSLEQLLSVSSDEVYASLPPSATCQVDAYPHWNQSQFDALPWDFLHSHRDVDTFVKHVPQSKLLAFRGVTLMDDVHISAALGPFVNVTQSLAWIPLLQHIEALPIIDRVDRQPYAALQDAWHRHRQAAAAEAAAGAARGSGSSDGDSNDASSVVEALVEALRHHRDQWRWTQSDTLYQLLHLPWPISPRDLQLYRHFTFDAAARQVTIRYFSVTEDDPDRLARWRQLLRRGGRDEAHVIRAVTPYTMWRFTAVPADVDTAASPPSDQQKQQQQPQSSPSTSSQETRLSPASASSPSAAFRRWLQTMRLRFQRRWAALVARWPLGRRRETAAPAKPTASTDDAAAAPAAASTATAPTAPTAGDGSSGVLPLTTCLPLPPSASGVPSPRTAHVLVEVETVVDSRGSIPAWFINFMQRQWPASTLSTFRSMAAKGTLDAHPAVTCW